MSRKTVDVDVLKTEVNSILANYTENGVHPEYLVGLRILLEFALHRSGNYRGFQFLDKTEVPFQQRCGCHFEYVSDPNRFVKDTNGVQVDIAFENTDCNRVRYY
jgi:hypothetical protein